MPSHNYSWNYGVAISGLTFSLFTNSGTVAIYPNTANLSAVISKDGSQAVAALGTVVSGVASGRFYSIATISAANMACYTWCVLITCNSGCQPTTIHGQNYSGPESKISDVSGIGGYMTSSWPYIDNIHTDVGTALSSILLNASGKALKTDVSAMNGILTAASGPVVLAPISHTSSLIARVTDLTNAGAPPVIDISSIASQVWNSLTTTYASSPTFGGAVMVSGKLATVSGLDNIVTAASGNDKILSAVSGLWVNGSGNDKILTAISNVPVAAGSSVAGIQTTDATVLTSGTLAHDARMIRHFTWNNMFIDKTYTPYRQYHYNGTNMSSWFDIADDSNTATRTRGG